MKTVLLTFSWAAAVTFAAATAVTADDTTQQTEADHGLVIIVHPDTEVTAVTRAELSKFFLKRLRAWSDGQMVWPVDQTPESPMRKAFSEHVLGRSVVNIEVYWKRMIFSGRALPPRELATDEEVVEFVRSTPGAVGYVSSGADLEGVRRLRLAE